MNPQIVLGLDFGGTKLAAGIVDLSNGNLLQVRQTKTDVSAGADGAVRQIIALARALPGIEEIQGIGVCFGGHVLNNQILRSVHVGSWENFPLTARLNDEFNVSTIRIENDANAVAFGEWFFGTQHTVQSLLYITVSTGIGGGIIMDGRIMDGYSGMAGEIGHTLVLPDGPACPCGKRGCLEAVAAGPAIARTATEYLIHYPHIQSEMRKHESLTAKIVAELAEQGDPLAIQSIQQSANYLGIAIANAVNLLDVECVVIGGGVSRAGEVWWEQLRKSAMNNLLPWREDLDLRKSSAHEFEGIMGASALLHNIFQN